MAGSRYAFNLRINDRLKDHDWLTVKLFALILTFVFMFLNFLQAQRYLNHLGFLLHVHTLDADQGVGLGDAASGEVVHVVNPEVAEQFMHRSYMHKAS